MEQGEIGSWLETELTGYVGSMLKDIILVRVILREHKISIHLQRLQLTSIIVNIFAHRRNFMRQKAFFISVCVLCVGQKMAKHTQPSN